MLYFGTKIIHIKIYRLYLSCNTSYSSHYVQHPNDVVLSVKKIRKRFKTSYYHAQTLHHKSYIILKCIGYSIAGGGGGGVVGSNYVQIFRS